MTKGPGWVQLGLAGRNGPLVDADAAFNLILMLVGWCRDVHAALGKPLVLYGSQCRAVSDRGAVGRC